MAPALISTKIHPPPLPRTHIERERLRLRLEAGKQGKLILVSAPAGFGKTTLVAEWADHCSQSCLVSWVHLDESDNEPIRFVSYIIAALQAHQTGLGEAALAGLQATPPAPMEAALTALVNEIDSLGRELILILDDYHFIDSHHIHAAVGFFVEHLPAQACLVIATRSDPPLPIHRLRAQGQLTEIRAADLRFSSQETRRFLEGILPQALSTGDLSALESRTEGWIAGLQMAALSMRGSDDIHEFIATFSGSHRYIIDYLTEEIYNQQPPPIQKFLLQTSFLDRLSGPLCEAVLGTGTSAQGEQDGLPPAQETLEYLERTNLFLLPLDDERHWYRYHRLFASLLQQRLRQTWPGEMPGLLTRAYTWCAANGLIDEALKYALSANDLPAAADLVENNALDVLKKGALSGLSGWLSKLPNETILERPWLSVYMSWVLLLTGNLENLERFLLAAEGGEHIPQNTGYLRGHLIAIRAYAVAMQGEADRAFTLAQKALEQLPEDELTVRSVVLFVLGGIHLMRKDFPGAIERMQEAGQIGERAGNVHVAVPALSAAGNLLLSLGELSEAGRIFERALKLSTGRSGRPLPIAANVYAGLAELNLRRRDLENARQFAGTGVELAEQWGNMDSLASNLLALAHVAHLEGNAAEVQASLEQAKDLAARVQLTPSTSERITNFEALIQSKPAGGLVPEGLVEPLSERELEVLKLIAEGRSNSEIADELIIALGTVKAHTSSIYGKLGVQGRTQAVIKAGELGLL